VQGLGQCLNRHIQHWWHFNVDTSRDVCSTKNVTHYNRKGEDKAVVMFNTCHLINKKTKKFFFYVGKDNANYRLAQIKLQTSG